MVHKEHCKAIQDFDNKYHYTPDDEIGPVKSALLSFEPVAGKYEGTTLGLGIGCMGELSVRSNEIYTPIARNRAVSYVLLRRQVAQGGPWLVLLKDPPPVGSWVFRSPVGAIRTQHKQRLLLIHQKARAVV